MHLISKKYYYVFFTHENKFHLNSKCHKQIAFYYKSNINDTL